MHKVIRRSIKLSIVLSLSLMIVIMTINFYVLSFGQKNYFTDIDKLPASEYGLVFGASVDKGGNPSLVLQDRLDTAISAYKLGKINTIIVSGFVSNDGYDEPQGMKNYLIQKDIPEENIHIDTQGVDTYNSLLQVKKYSGQNSIILFTQDFHLKRAIYIADKLGLTFSGMETNSRTYKKNNYFRELGARIKAFIELDILRNIKKYLSMI